LSTNAISGISLLTIIAISALGIDLCALSINRDRGFRSITICPSFLIG
jgi:hypothetical protein